MDNSLQNKGKEDKNPLIENNFQKRIVVPHFKSGIYRHSIVLTESVHPIT